MSNTIFIIDDDEDVRTVMCYALEFEGLRTMAFEDGKRAIEFLATLSPSEWPCLMIIDYLMPQMSGVEFINHLRDRWPDTLAKIPMALNTARGAVEDVPSGIRILHKPLDLHDLIEVAKSHCPKGRGMALSS